MGCGYREAPRPGASTLSRIDGSQWSHVVVASNVRHWDVSLLVHYPAGGMTWLHLTESQAELICEALGKCLDEEYRRTHAGVPLHYYISTACAHERCGECRLTCKFCDQPCQCECHGEVTEERHDKEKPQAEAVKVHVTGSVILDHRGQRNLLRHGDSLEALAL